VSFETSQLTIAMKKLLHRKSSGSGKIMAAEKKDILIINGIRNDGTVDDVRASSLGQISFSTAGSCHVSTYLPRELFNVNQFILDHHLQQQINVKHILSHSVVFCEISDPDSHSIALRKARNLFDALHDKIQWINNPHNVPNTRRSRVPELLSDIEGVTAPQTVRVIPKTIADIQSSIESNTLSFPLLIRPAGSHGGKDLVLLEKQADLQNLELSKYPEAFITDFVDSGDNGIYSKYRFAVVAGEPLLRHVLSNDHWMIHSEARAFTSSRPDLQKYEADILSNFEQELKQVVQKPIQEIYQRMGLDYFGIDCAIKDGQIILFEVNANMNILNNNQPLPNIWEEAIEKIVERIVNKLILPRIK